MRLRLKALLTLCALCAALITGSTMAWFTDEVTAADTVFTAGTVDISADRLVTGGGEPHYYTKIGYCVKCLDQNDVCRDRKFKNNETGRANVLSILTSLNPVWISSRYYSFYTLGSGGTLTLKLNTPMTAGSGQRVIKYLSGGDSSDSGNEKALLEVSADGRDYTAVETLTKNTQMVTISIPDTILFDIRYIRITDLPQPASPSTRCCCPPPPCSDDGYDLAWLECGILGGGTWNPGDANELSYRINNVGSKNIKLRVRLSGVWQEQINGVWQNTGLSVANVLISPLTPGWNLYTPPVSTGSGVTCYVYEATIPGSYGQAPGYADLRLSVMLLSGPVTGPEYQNKRFVLTPVFEAIQASHIGQSESAYQTEPKEPEGWSWYSFDTYN
jgi:predicted ribosomally synthesized peptide with SipW-like signal peptide